MTIGQGLRTAAAELFHERGLHVSLKEIARHAGVSHGTLYSLFCTREALIDEIVTDLAAARLDEAAEQALAFENAGDGFAYYVEKVCELHADDPALNDVLTRRYPDANGLVAVSDRAHAAAARIIERAHRAGTLRLDFTNMDLLFMFAAQAPLARAVAGAAPGAGVSPSCSTACVPRPPAHCRSSR